MTAGVAHPVGAHEEVHVTLRRVLATLVDFLIFATVGSAMAYYFGTFAVLHDAFGVKVLLAPVGWTVWIALIAIYYVLMEGYLGQTVGKMLTGIKVVRGGTGEVPGLKRLV